MACVECVSVSLGASRLYVSACACLCVSLCLAISAVCLASVPLSMCLFHPLCVSRCVCLSAPPSTCHLYLKTSASAFGVPCDRATVAAVMESFDRNGDGYIDTGEFLYAFFNRRKLLRQWDEDGKKEQDVAKRKNNAPVTVEQRRADLRKQVSMVYHSAWHSQEALRVGVVCCQLLLHLLCVRLGVMSLCYRRFWFLSWCVARCLADACALFSSASL